MKKKPAEKRSALFGRPAELLIEENAVPGAPSPLPMQREEPRPNRRGGRGPHTLSVPVGDPAAGPDPFPRALRPVPPSLDEAQTILEEEEEVLAVSDGDYDTEESLPAGDDEDEATAISLVDDDPRVADEQVTLIDPAAVRAKNTQASEGLGIQVRLRTARAQPTAPVEPILDRSLNDLEERVRPRTDLSVDPGGERSEDDAAFDAGVFDEHPVEPAPRAPLGGRAPPPPEPPLVGPVRTEPTVFMSGVHVRPVGSQPPVRSAASGAPHALRTPGRLGPPPETRAALLAAEVDDLANLSSSAPTTAPASAPPRRVAASLAPMDTGSEGTPVTPMAVVRGMSVPPRASGRTPTAPPAPRPTTVIPLAPPAGAGLSSPSPVAPASTATLPRRPAAAARPTVPVAPAAAHRAPPPPAEPTPANVRPATPRNDGPAMMVVGVLIGLMIAGGIFWLKPHLTGTPSTVAPVSADPTPPPVALVAPPAATPPTTPAAEPTTGAEPATADLEPTLPPVAVASVDPVPANSPTPTSLVREVASAPVKTTPPITRLAAEPRTLAPPADTLEADEVRLEAGYIRVLTDRKCLVIVDGQQRGYAPGVGQIQLAPGGHTLRCIVAGAGASRETDFRVDSGALREIELRFGQ